MAIFEAFKISFSRIIQEFIDPSLGKIDFLLVSAKSTTLFNSFNQTIKVSLYILAKNACSPLVKASRFDKVDTSSTKPAISHLTIHIGRCQIQCPHGVSLTDFVSLIDHLA